MDIYNLLLNILEQFFVESSTFILHSKLVRNKKLSKKITNI